MSGKAPPFKLFFEIVFLESYSRLELREKKAIDKAVKLLAANPRHPSLNVHKAKNVTAKYPVGGNDVFITYATKNLRLTSPNHYTSPSFIHQITSVISVCEVSSPTKRQRGWAV